MCQVYGPETHGPYIEYMTRSEFDATIDKKVEATGLPRWALEISAITGNVHRVVIVNGATGNSGR